MKIQYGMVNYTNTYPVLDAKQLVKLTPLLCPLLLVVAALPAELVLAVAVAAELVVGAAAGE